MRSAAIVMRQAMDAAAMYIPIHGIGLLNLVSSMYPSMLQPFMPISLGVILLFLGQMLLAAASAYAAG